MRLEQECRVKRSGGKLVAGRAVLQECRVVELQLWGEFFADPTLDQLISSLSGLNAREAMERVEHALSETWAAPREDILECIRRLLSPCLG